MKVCAYAKNRFKLCSIKMINNHSVALLFIRTMRLFLTHTGSIRPLMRRVLYSVGCVAQIGVAYRIVKAHEPQYPILLFAVFFLYPYSSFALV